MFCHSDIFQRKHSYLENQIIVRKSETLNALVWLIVIVSHILAFLAVVHSANVLFICEIELIKNPESPRFTVVRPAPRQVNPRSH